MTFSFASLIFILLLVLCIYLVLVRPERKRQKNSAIMLNSVVKGSVVYTVDGIKGRVEELRGGQVLLYCFPDETPIYFDLEAIEKIDNYDKKAAKRKMKEKIQRKRKK